MATLVNPVLSFFAPFASGTERESSAIFTERASWRPVWEFVVYSIVGSFLFAIAGAAILLKLAIVYVLVHWVPNFGPSHPAQPLVGRSGWVSLVSVTADVLVGIDLILFMMFL